MFFQAAVKERLTPARQDDLHVLPYQGQGLLKNAFVHESLVAWAIMGGGTHGAGKIAACNRFDNQAGAEIFRRP